MLKKLYIIIMVISLAVVGVVAFKRINVEAQHKFVEMVLDYDEAKLLAEQSDESLQWWMEFFKSIGFGSVAVKESTIENLIADGQDLEYTVVEELKKDTYWKTRFADDVTAYIENKTDRYDVVLRTPSTDLFKFISEGLSKRYPSDFYTLFEGDMNVVILDGEAKDALYSETGFLVDEDGKNKRTLRSQTDSKLAWIGLGFDPSIIETVQKSGLDVLPRPSNFHRFPEKLVEAFADEMDKYGIEPKYFVFQGEEVLGYDLETENLDALYAYMHENNISAGLIESGVQRSQTKQEGLVELTKMLDYDAVRIFPIVGYIQERYQWYGYKGAEEIENTIYRAVTERNIRSVYFRPFKKKDNEILYVTDSDMYKASFDNLQERLAEHHIQLGSASKLQYNEPGVLNLIVIGYGLVVLSIIALNSVIPIRERHQAMLLSVGVLGVTAANLVVPNFAVVLMALGTSILFPVLAAIAILDILKQFLINRQIDKIHGIILKGFILVIISAAIAMVGGIFIGSILSSSSYLLEMEYFRGVKISQLAPLVLFCVIYIIRFGYGRSVNAIEEDSNYVFDLKRLLNERIKVLHVLIVGAVGIVGIIYIARTGHETSIQPTNIEMIFRNFLEYNFIARPRSKELLLAFPSVMVAVYMASKGWKASIFPMTAVIMIGVTSVVNTFSHLRAPMYLSIARTIYGAGLGALIGVALILILNLLVHAVINLRGRHADE